MRSKYVNNIEYLFKAFQFAVFTYSHDPLRKASLFERDEAASENPS